jgi:hypothetical protein
MEEDKLLKVIKSIDENFAFEDKDSSKSWVIVNSKYETRSFFFKEEFQEIVKIELYLKKLIGFEYKKNELLYRNDEFEIIISSLFDDQTLNQIEETSKDFPSPPDKENIYYKISNFSNFFFDRIFLIESYPWEFYQTIKIYNINSVTGQDFKSDKFLKLADHICKSIAFEVEQKLGIDIRFMNPKIDEKQGKAFYSPIYELDDKILGFNRIDFERYDKDLLNYYYRACAMEDSEFKYLAFFQIVECLFDEVFKSELVQDIRIIIESDWFSPEEDTHLEQMISIIDRYNHEKNDRTKTKLVLERYFKLIVHDEAYILANKKIANVLKDLRLIANDSDLKDLQKISNIIYDFRCECTHSNRSYPIQRDVNKSGESLNLYISLIKKIAQKIILNYKKK